MDSSTARTEVDPHGESLARSSNAGPERVLSHDALAVVLIHGIGDIAPGDVLSSSVTAFERHLGLAAAAASLVTPGVRSSGAHGHATVRKAEVQWSGRQIDLVEFNWTTLIGKIRLGHPFDAIRKLLGVLRDVPALGSIGSASSSDRAILSICAWLYQGIFLALLLTVVATVVHELARHEAYRDALLPLKTQHAQQPTSSSDEAAARGAEEGTVILRVFDCQDSAFPSTVMAILWGMLLSLATLPYVLSLYAIVRVLRGFHLRRAALVLLAAGIGLVLTALAGWSLMMAGMFAFQLGLTLTEPQSNLWERLAQGMLFTWLFFWLPAKAVVAFGNLMRDVVHYLAPDRSGALTANQLAVRTELWQLISGLQAEGRYARIVLIAHSLGTVILTDLLLERASSARGILPIPIDLVTAGSPLRRLVHRFFPDRTPDLLAVRRQLADGPGVRVVRWFNAYRLADYVGQALTHSAFPRDFVGARSASGDPQTAIGDHLLSPSYQWPVAHANYWKDPRFVRFVALEVIRPLLDSSTKPSETAVSL